MALALMAERDCRSILGTTLPRGRADASGSQKLRVRRGPKGKVALSEGVAEHSISAAPQNQQFSANTPRTKPPSKARPMINILSLQ